MTVPPCRRAARLCRRSAVPPACAAVPPSCQSVPPPCRWGLANEDGEFTTEYPSPAPDGITIAVADRSNHRIRLVVAATGAVTTLAGNGASTYADGVGTAAAFNGPTGVAYAPDGATLAIADRSNHRVRLVSVATGVVTTLAGSGAASFADGLAAAASFDRPLSVAYAPTGDEIAVADRSNHRVRAVSTCSPAGTEPPTVAPTSSVVGLFSEKPTSVPRAFHVDPALSY
eukprot:gene17908-biopygen25867